MKGSRKFLYLSIICLMLITVFIPVVFGCSGVQPPATSAPTSAPTSATTPATKPITLKYHSWMPEGHPATSWYKVWQDKVVEKSGGQIQFQNYYGGELGTAADQMSNMNSGLFDIGHVSIGKDPSRLPLTQIASLPWVPSFRSAARYYAVCDLNELKPMQDEWAQWGVKFLWPISMTDLYCLFLVDKPVYTVADIKGLTIFGTGKMGNALLLAGANPIDPDPAEEYEMLQKKIVDGGATTFPSATSRKLWEVCDYVSTIWLGWGGPQLGISLRAYNSLPESSKQAIAEATKEYGLWQDSEEAKFAASARKGFEDNGMKVIDFPAAEQKKYEDLATTKITEEWIKEVEAKGLPGRMVYETLRDAAKKYENQYK